MSWEAYPSRARVSDEDYHKTGKWNDLHHTDIPFLKELGIDGGDEPYVGSALKYILQDLTTIDPCPKSQWIAPEELAEAFRQIHKTVHYFGEFIVKDRNPEVMQVRDLFMVLSNRGIGLMVSY